MFLPDRPQPSTASLRGEIARLEDQISEVISEAFPETIELAPLPPCAPGRVLGSAQLEELRAGLSGRLRGARRQLENLRLSQQAARLQLEAMLQDPSAYRGLRISFRQLGEPGCGVYRSAPRLGIIGRMMGWWQVKLSSGCP